MNAQPSLPGARPAGSQDEQEAAHAVREMFGRIAPRYDLLNRVLSLTLDQVWRRRTARAFAGLLQQPEARALDLCCGTGDLTLALARAGRGRVIGSDFVHPMLVRARRKASGAAKGAAWLEADALQMPFPDQQFDVVTVAFGFRNLANYQQGLKEIYRLLRPGGRVGILEFSLPESGVFAAVYRFYLRSVLPRVGNSVSGSGPTPGGQRAYSYLPASVEKFPNCQKLAAWMEQEGFEQVSYQRWTGGVVALHAGTKMGTRG